MNGDDGDEEQFTLFPLPARNTDPYTSWIAGAAQTPEHTAPIRAAVLLTLHLYGPLSDAGLHSRISAMADHHVAESSPRKRRGELEGLGYIEACGEETSMFGKPTLLWHLTENGAIYVTTYRDVLVARAATRGIHIAPGTVG